MTISFTEIKKQFKQYLSLYKSLLADNRTPKMSKLLLSAAIGYTLLPFDLIPDFIPIIGHIDDVIIIPSLIYFAVKMIPKELYEEHKKKIFRAS